MQSTTVVPATQLLDELKERFLNSTLDDRLEIKRALKYLAAEEAGDPLCVMCSHPESEHAAHGDWCPNPASEDQLFNYSQTFVRDLQSLRKGA